MNLRRDISEEHLKRLFELIPKLKSIEGPFAESGIETENGHVSIGPMDWIPELEELHRLIYKSGLVMDFNWPEWQPEAVRYFDDPTLLESADFITIRRLLTTHVRKERFCEGHLPDVCENGHMQAIIERLQELWENGDIETR